MANRRHHYACRCNQCVRQRNARRRRTAERYAEGGNALPSRSLWYEVEADHPVRYEGDPPPPSREQRTDPGPPQGGEWMQADADPAREMEFAPPDDGDKDDMQHPEESAQETERPESPMHYRRDDMEWERERHLQDFRRQQEERQRDSEQRREELLAEQETNVRRVADEQDNEISEEPDTPKATDAEVRRRRPLLVLAIIVSILVLAAGGSLLTFALLASPERASRQQVAEPPPDLNATVVSAVALALPLLTPSPPAPTEVPPDERNAVPTATPTSVVRQPTLTATPNRPAAIAPPVAPPATATPTVRRPATATPTIPRPTPVRLDTPRENRQIAPLTAGFENMPYAHDGRTPFIFELRFSEEFELSYKTLRDQAFVVHGGNVERARRMNRPSNIHWKIHVRPEGAGSVTVLLDKTTDCAADGAICTADGRALSSNLLLTVAGP